MRTLDVFVLISQFEASKSHFSVLYILQQSRKMSLSLHTSSAYGNINLRLDEPTTCHINMSLRHPTPKIYDLCINAYVPN